MAVPVEGSPAEESRAAPVYPVFLRLDGRRVLLVGGGRVAAAKLPALLEAGAHVTVVAPAIGPELKRAAPAISPEPNDLPPTIWAEPNGLAPTISLESKGVAPAISPKVKASSPTIVPERKRGGVTIVERAFEPADLEGASFVVAAAPSEVNRAVAVAAEARGLFVNAVDDAASASALLGGVVHRGGVTVAVSTGGRAPALAGLLREALEAVLPEDVEAWVSLGERIRAQWKQRDIAMRDRRPLLLHALQDLYATKEAP